MMKFHVKSYAYRILIVSILMLGMSQGLWASIPPTPDAVNQGWQAYDAGRFDEVLIIWEKLARQGDVNAQVNLGIMYDTGRVGAADPTTAVKWYRAAAEKGSPDAQYNLGLMFRLGRGVARDISFAAQWFHKAALQNLPMAQYELGLLYAEGLDTAQYAWLPSGVLFGSGSTITAAGDIAADGLELAVRWFFKSGLTYLAQGESKGAWQALSAIRSQAENHPLEQALQEEISTYVIEKKPDNPSRSHVGGSVGTAWPIATGYVVTNNHVVEESTDVLLITESGQEIRAWTVLRDEANDIALLEVNDIGKLPLAIPLSSLQADLGSSVFTVGFPRIDVLGDTPKQSQGVISQLHGLQDDPLSYQTTVPIQPGNSGGPLINMRGEAVGMIKAMIGIREETHGNIEPLPNASCALKIEGVRNLALLLPQQEPLLGELPHLAGNMGNLTDRIKGSVLIVVAR